MALFRGERERGSFKHDGLVKSLPLRFSGGTLCCILKSFNVRLVLLVITKFARLFIPMFFRRGI